MKVLVRGSGDVGSAVAHLLFGLDYQVVIHELEAPAYTRRGMAFADAVFDGKVSLEGVWAKCPPTREDLQRMLVCGHAIPVLVCPLDEALTILQPDVLVDARMRKHSMPEVQRNHAPLTIGLGPNFIAGQHTHLAIETAWGESLGAVLHDGATLPQQGEPRTIEGMGRERCIYAPAAGVLTTTAEIGKWVEAGEEIALLDAQPLHAPVSGYIRGVCHSGVAVKAGTKVLEMDPRREGASLYGLGERPQKIAEAVLSAINKCINSKIASSASTT